jgi:hypothetical protein
MNAMFCNGNGDRRYKVNVARCPVYADCLEQQVWDKTASRIKRAITITPTMAPVTSL